MLINMSTGNDMKPTSNFKLSKPTKTLLALGKFTDQSQRDAWKLIMIQAQLASMVKVSRSKSESAQD